MSSSTTRSWGVLLGLAAALLTVLVMASPATAAITEADIDPSWKSYPNWETHAYWWVSWEATGSNSWQFTYGQNNEGVTYVDVGNGLELADYDFGNWCGSPLTKFKYQALKVGSTTYDTSTVKLNKTSQAC